MNRHTKAASVLALLSVLVSGCCGPGYPCPAPTDPTPSPSHGSGDALGIAVGVAAAGAIGVATAVAVNHERHILKGCVSSGPDGLRLTKDSDKKTYSLVGITADVKSGEKVRLHGTKQKKQKGSPGNQQFLVERVSKDLGPCEVVAASAATPGSAPSR
jgi:hypothetical protein